MTAQDIPSALATARAAARAGGAVIQERGSGVGNVRTKSTIIDFVTETDVASGVKVAQRIAADFEGARFVIEEDEVYDLAGVARGELEDDAVWVVDPLDGTTSFVHGFPCYSVSVALLAGGVPVVGAVYNVVSDEMFSAGAGLGATLGDETLRCGDRERLEDALMVTGFPYDRTVTLDRQLDVLARMMRAPIHGMRRDGSAAVDCTHVAAGRADGFWEFGLQPWDTAAGVVILRESGAHVTDTDGSEWSTRATGIVAANPVLHERMLALISGV